MLANSIAPTLSLYTLYLITGCFLINLMLYFCVSSAKLSKRMTLGMAVLSATYLASVVLKLIVDCSFKLQIMGQPWYFTIYLVRDRQSCRLVSKCLEYPPAKLASTKHSIPFVTSTDKIYPLSFIFFRNQIILFTAFTWHNFGSSQKWAHCWTAN